MSATRQDVVDIIKSWKNMKECDGSYKPIIDIYNSISPLPLNYRLKYTDAWGPGTVSAVYQQAGIASHFPCECSCARMVTRAKEMDLWEEDDNYLPKIADVCLYDEQDILCITDSAGVPDGVGLVISVDKKSRTFVIMEGNVESGMGTRTLSAGNKYIRGFICPIFEEESSTIPPDKTETIITPDDEEIKEPTLVVGTGILSKIAAGAKLRLQHTPVYASPKTFSVSDFKTGDYYLWSVDTVNNRVRITNSKNNVGVRGQVTAWIDTSDAIAFVVEQSALICSADTPAYQVNAVYVVQFDDIQIRKGPGTNYDPVEYADLTANAKKYDKNRTGCLCRGAKVTCLDAKIVGMNVWMQIPSGWIPAYYNKRSNVK